MPPRTGELVIYIDESGRPDVISTAGQDLVAAGNTSNHLVIAALRCPDPNAVARSVAACIAWADAQPDRTRRRGKIDHLHAGKDDDKIRAHVCSELVGLPVKATAIVMDKRLLQSASPWRTDRRRFYNELTALLLSDSLHLYERTRIVFSRKDFETSADLNVMAQDVANRWSSFLTTRGILPPALVDVRASQRRMVTVPGLQAVDYIAWAVFRVFESGDLTYFRVLEPIIGHVWDLSRLTHYHRRNRLTTASGP